MQIKVHKVLEGPIWMGDACGCGDCLLSDTHFLEVMATDQSCEDGEWFDTSMWFDSFNDAYNMKKASDRAFEPIIVETNDE